MTFSRHYLAQQATLDAVDLAEVQGCRRAHNQLGFAYQVGFVRLLNRFPKQEPFEVLDELLLFTGMQLGVDSTLIEEYRRRRQTISEHQQRITAVQISWAEQRRLLKTREKASPKGCFGDQVAALDKIEIMLLSQLGLHSRQ